MSEVRLCQLQTFPLGTHLPHGWLDEARQCQPQPSQWEHITLTVGQVRLGSASPKPLALGTHHSHSWLDEARQCQLKPSHWEQITLRVN